MQYLPDGVRSSVHLPSSWLILQAVKEQQWANAFMQLRPPEAPLVAVRPNNIALKDHYGLTTDEFARGNCNGAISQTHVWHMDVSDSPQMPEASKNAGLPMQFGYAW